ncbi:hypothetical protein FB451DRAFT_1172015 [Mycena latifolia]|nr:hypothetical protein FB451DRAFT_1172015 [Mycena latifolia]
MYSHTIGINCKGFVEVRLMVKFTNLEDYHHQDQMLVGLNKCVRNVLGLQREQWDEMTPQHILYAGLGAQASLDVYQVIKLHFDIKDSSIPRGIPEDWYKHNFANSLLTQLGMNIVRVFPAKFCSWYNRGSFRGVIIERATLMQ